MAETSDGRRTMTIGVAALPGGATARHAVGALHADKARVGPPGSYDMSMIAEESGDAGHVPMHPQGSHASAPPATIGRQTLTVEEAAALLGIGRNSAYQAIARGELPALRLG